MEESLPSVAANVVDCDNAVSVFKLQSCYYIHFHPNILGKGMNFLSYQPPWVI